MKFIIYSLFIIVACVGMGAGCTKNLPPVQNITTPFVSKTQHFSVTIPDIYRSNNEEAKKSLNFPSLTGESIGPVVIIEMQKEDKEYKEAKQLMDSYINFAKRIVETTSENGMGMDCNIVNISSPYKTQGVECRGEGGASFYAIIETENDRTWFVDGYPFSPDETENVTKILSSLQEYIN